MYEIIHKLFNRAARRLALESGWARRHFDSHRGHFRVLTYHGIVPDELAARPWVPSHYVSVSQFERQMAMLAELGPARPLSRVLEEVRADPDAPPSVCITFDDGMADNVTLGLPILRKYGHLATFFLATGYIGTDRLLLNDVIRLLRPLNGHVLSSVTSEDCQRAVAENGYAKTISLSKYAPEVLGLWQEHRHEIDPAAVQCLAMMTWEQAHELQAAGMEVGAHTVNHVILSCEKRRTRRDEILESIARVRSKLRRFDVPFAYPNGLAGDYDRFDTDILAAIGVPFAVTEQPGWNGPETPPLELHRIAIGRHCSDQAFLAAVFGLNEPLTLRRRSA
ncbi:MAG TPA: polysaccharide deacetylase family protein [Phycisphaerae bacterium]|nr:polysaccharide deacetylase family protein [Phycisphaerae bacterium]HOJ72621.1 polysaccharide deacetylase family protein [Phycisphaerae bacterium]HOM49718.1 polysaccharide deacetylase family protein [Phycisphaerae bacterium]HON67994.1 polysaccharide deacetylase family protein [Phycisphaerae bacterium]HOQ84837.1 polysaccharide deacetylase family protein [Phycisphaerae bacterium]